MLSRVKAKQKIASFFISSGFVLCHADIASGANFLISSIIPLGVFSDTVVKGSNVKWKDSRYF